MMTEAANGANNAGKNPPVCCSFRRFCFMLKPRLLASSRNLDLYFRSRDFSSDAIFTFPCRMFFAHSHRARIKSGSACSIIAFRVSGFDEQLKTQSMFLHSTRHIFNPNRLTLPTKFNSRFTSFDTMQTPSVRRPTGVHRPAVWTCADACHRACSVSGRSEDSHKEWTLHRRTPPEQT